MDGVKINKNQYISHPYQAKAVEKPTLTASLYLRLALLFGYNSGPTKLP
jgi:hypothetical protein